MVSSLYSRKERISGAIFTITERGEQRREVAHGADVLLEDRHGQDLAMRRRLQHEAAQAGLGQDQTAAAAELTVVSRKPGSMPLRYVSKQAGQRASPEWGSMASPQSLQWSS